jgi:excisionase family DNA binding protein
MAETPRQAGGIAETGDVLTVHEVARYLKLPASTVYTLAQRGELPGCKVGRQWRFFKPGLELRLLAQQNPDREKGAGSPRNRRRTPPDQSERDAPPKDH